MAKPHVIATSDHPTADQRPAALLPLHLLAVGSGLALIVGAANNQAVTLSSQFLPQLPAPGIPVVRALVGVVGLCVMGWGLGGLFGSALTRAVRHLIRWRPPALATADEATRSATSACAKPDVDVRLRGDNPIVVDLSSTVPNVSIWFEVISHCAVDAVLERITLKLWAGQPVLTGTMDNRHPIPAHSTVPNVWFSGELTPGAVERIRQEMARRGPRGRYTVYGTAYFSSPNGPFEVQLLRQEREIPPTD